jgi:hypothetical protein
MIPTVKDGVQVPSGPLPNEPLKGKKKEHATTHITNKGYDFDHAAKTIGQKYLDSLTRTQYGADDKEKEAYEKKYGITVPPTQNPTGHLRDVLSKGIWGSDVTDTSGIGVRTPPVPGVPNPVLDWSYARHTPRPAASSVPPSTGPSPPLRHPELYPGAGPASVGVSMTPEERAKAERLLREGRVPGSMGPPQSRPPQQRPPVAASRPPQQRPPVAAFNPTHGAGGSGAPPLFSKKPKPSDGRQPSATLVIPGVGATKPTTPPTNIPTDGISRTGKVIGPDTFFEGDEEEWEERYGYHAGLNKGKGLDRK